MTRFATEQVPAQLVPLRVLVVLHRLVHRLRPSRRKRSNEVDF